MKKVIVFLIMIITSCLLINVYAASKNINVTDIGIKEKSSTITVDTPVLSNNQISSNIKFNQEDDYVIFELTIKNDESIKYKIKSISDNNTSSNLDIQYTYDNNYIETGSTKKVLIKMTYNNHLVNQDLSLNNLEINFDFEGEDGSSGSLLINPLTGDNIINYVLLFSITLLIFTLVLINKNGKISNKLLLLLILIIPFSVFAKETFELKFKFTDIVVKGEFETFDVTIDPNNGTAASIVNVTYGQTFGSLQIAEPSKTDMVFDGWLDNNNSVVTNSTVITSALTITAQYAHPCRTFATDSWSTIVTNLATNSNYYSSTYSCTKTIDMDLNNDSTNETYTVRLVNTSRPDVCNNTDNITGELTYSQTSCGTVIEFVNVVGTRTMNTSNTSNGGWRSSELISWLNSDIYNKLPSDLRSVIIPTYPIISSSGSGEPSLNITSEDSNINKLFVLSVKELGIDSNYDNKNNPLTDTRILDFYNANNNNDSRLKRDVSFNSASFYWTRTAYSEVDTHFFGISITGALTDFGSSFNAGVAPAFRIGIQN